MIQRVGYIPKRNTLVLVVVGVVASSGSVVGVEHGRLAFGLLATSRAPFLNDCQSNVSRIYSTLPGSAEANVQACCKFKR